MKKFNLLSTDFYQIPMTLAYILSGKGDEITGFESFYRHPKKEVNEQGFYYFSGEKEVKEFIEVVRKELEDPEFVETFLKLIMPKVNPEKRATFEDEVREFMKYSSKEFEFTVYQEDAVLLPYVPAFQFKGPKWIGQLLETPITNIINGRTGLNTQRHLGKANAAMEAIVYGNRDSVHTTLYIEKLQDKAIQFRLSTDKVLLDASFRRAPGYWISVKAAEIALKNNWQGSSHVGALFDVDSISLEMIGGTMAHAFIMSFETELEAFRIWNEIFPGAPILVDTYDTINAVKTLIKENIKPESVRIDSGDMRIVCREVRALLDENGWQDVGIYISGDMTPELLSSFELEGVPFDKAMAGTKFVNIDEGAQVNGGFVYKVVEYTTKSGERVLPEKKAEGKTNYPGLKTVTVENGKVVLSVVDDNIGLNNLNQINETMEVDFIRNAA